MIKQAIIVFVLLFWGLSGPLQAEEKVNVKARVPGVEVEYKSNPTPPPQPVQPVVVEKETVVTEQKKEGCSCNMIPSTSVPQSLLGIAIVLTMGLIPAWRRKKEL
jgi:hypothetical protein